MLQLNTKKSKDYWAILRRLNDIMRNNSNEIMWCNKTSIFSGSGFARTVGIKFILAMARPWSKLTERYVIF